jgi:sulfoxide reductase catalytic subunit YedY
MTLIRIAKSWELSENSITSESLYYNRRSFIKTLVGAGITASLIPLTGCQKSNSETALNKTFQLPKIDKVTPNSAFQKVDRPMTKEELAARYNNFYEFGGSKNIWLKAQKLPTENWKLEVTGLVNNPKTYDLDDLKKNFTLEERIYRFRCVEAWSMVLPWIGFAMPALIKAVEPKSEAKFVRFTSFYDAAITTGPGLHLGALPWPYKEGLRIEEMNNELAFFALGIYGHDLPKQHGAPIRCVLPWKYGFKGAKSVVKIEFLASQPATYWNSIDAYEYDFEANVNPSKPHPRWSQATEKFISTGPGLSWELKATLPYNGYGKYVANLYN